MAPLLHRAAIKKYTKKPKHVTSHVFAETTHAVAAPCGFACVVIPPTQLYIPSLIKIRSGVWEPLEVEICPFPLLWLLAFTTACTTMQAVKIWNIHFVGNLSLYSRKKFYHDDVIIMTSLLLKAQSLSEIFSLVATLLGLEVTSKNEQVKQIRVNFYRLKLQM